MIRKYCLIVSMVVTALLSSCSDNADQNANPLVGVWEIYDAEFLYDDATLIQDVENFEGVELWVHTSDSIVYDVCVKQDKDSREYFPVDKARYDFSKNADGSVSYFLNGHKCQLTIVNDTTIRLKKVGNVFYMRRTNAYDEDLKELMPSFGSENIQYHEDNFMMLVKNRSYKVTLQEKEQKGVINIMLLVLAVVGVLLIGLGVHVVISRRQKILMRQQLKRLQDEKDHLTADRLQAFVVAEQKFWNSEFYVDFCSRIDRMATFDDDYWTELEHQVNVAFPRFIPNLRSIVKLSQVEFRTSLLIKLKVAPSMIASVVHREPTTISSIRSRLYKKVFDKKGSPQQWDEFVSSI